MPFSELGLSPEVIRAVADAGYSTPTPIQAQAIPVVLMGRKPELRFAFIQERARFVQDIDV